MGSQPLTRRIADSNGDEIDPLDTNDQPLDVSAATVTVTDDGNFVLDATAQGTLPVEQQTPVALEDEGGTAISESNPLSAAKPNQSNLAFGEDTVTTSGTAEALNGGSSQAVPNGHAVAIRALNSNTGQVYVGDSTVGTADGYPLDSGETISLSPDDVSAISIDVDTGGEGVRWIVEAA